MTNKLSKRVLHKQVYRTGPFGGTLNTTLCGRLRMGNEMNVTQNDEEVTCSFCKRKMRAISGHFRGA